MIRCESSQTMSTMLVYDEISFKKSYLRVGIFIHATKYTGGQGQYKIIEY